MALDRHAFALSVMLLTQIIDLQTEVRELRGATVHDSGKSRSCARLLGGSSKRQHIVCSHDRLQTLPRQAPGIAPLHGMIVVQTVPADLASK